MSAPTLQSSDLIHFLLARIAEDEQTVADLRYTARTHRDQLADSSEPMYDNLTRALREAKAKRQIVERAALALAEVESKPTTATVLQALMGGHALGALGAVYADHPDYRDEWKP